MQIVVRISRLLILSGLVLAACGRSPAPAAQRAGAPATEAVALTCTPPQRVCTGCTGQPICAIHCPECPPPAAPPSADVPAALAVAPAVETCGGATCRPGTSCCNASCGICTPKGVECTQQSCD